MSLQAQLLKEVSLEKQIKNSDLVIEGEVIARKSFWDANHSNIYTSNTVKVYKVFKGEPNALVDIITLGGIVGTEALVATPSLRLKKGDIGVFNLKENLVPFGFENKSVNKRYRGYASVQSFYKYNLYNVAVNPFSKKKRGISFLYNDIMSVTNTSYTEMASMKSVDRTSKSDNSGKVLLPPASITFSPTTITAGTKAVLTINGTGFGITQGKVGFSNADDGGATFTFALDSEVLSWSDTVITVEVPSQAGTGTILVQDSGAVNGFSASTLTVTYAEINVIFDPDDQTTQMPPGSDGPLGFYAYQIRHINANAAGGYTWEMQTDFFNDTEHPGAKAAFERALDRWVCETGVNWTISNSATAVDEVSSDGTNVVRFDNGSELPDGLLGRCTSRFSGCGIFGDVSSWNWHVTEMDIVFDDDVNDPITPGTEAWYFGSGLPAINEYDFESVALHELGHGHQLAHVIDPVVDGDNQDDVMHYALSIAESQKVIGGNNSTAANAIQSRSNSFMACTEGLMTDASCPLSIDEDQLEEVISIFPNPTADQFQIKNASFINLEKAVIYDVSGRQISIHDLTNSPRIKTIDMIGISSGIYFVNIFSENTKITRKVVLE
ncbi:T9SS type A sorting domain-containing protein [Seonamhaeicola sp.]|uniref:T9SS type A sorting domain-containing protein n=1 Tax=Seonamhaeicola sp. TaxID=1912245 RepID=UPI00263410F6|nr:T9SS type A sorting domain-containing protein [Seonamhaeicola sp.]